MATNIIINYSPSQLQQLSYLEMGLDFGCAVLMGKSSAYNQNSWCWWTDFSLKNPHPSLICLYMSKAMKNISVCSPSTKVKSCLTKIWNVYFRTEHLPIKFLVQWGLKRTATCYQTQDKFWTQINKKLQSYIPVAGIAWLC